MRELLIALILAVGLAPRSGAQMAVVSGTVFRDSAYHPVGGATVSIPLLNRSTRTNYLGEFRIDAIPAGRYALTIRFLGFAPFADSVAVDAGQTLEREFILTQSAVMLDSQRVVANAEIDEPHMAEFEERRKLGFGYFIDTKELRKIESGRPLASYLTGRVPSLRLYRPDPNGHPTEYYLGGGHGTASFERAAAMCPVAIFIDGAAFYVPGLTPGSRPPDLSGWSIDDYSAVEYYPSAGSIPPRYAITQQSCGLILLWRRYKR
jgi:hypothetical protein